MLKLLARSWVLLVVGLCLASVTPLAAQTPPPTPELDEELRILDSTWTAYHRELRYAQRRAIGAPKPLPPGSHPWGFVSDDVYAERLKLLCNVVPMDYNVHVKGQIEYFIGRKRDWIAQMLGLQHVYFPIFESVFDQMGLPLELRNLAIIESGLNPAAKSRVAATGLWQFMHYTARLYDIRMDSYIDERSDPYKATVAAGQYLKLLHSLYDDWLLAIAAYNCGPGRVNWAIRKAGEKNVWAVYKYLPRETRGYVPAFIAACYAMSYWHEHGIQPSWVDFEYGPDSLVVVRRELHLSRLAQQTGVNEQLLYDLNPALKLGVVPYSDQPFVVRVPTGVARFAEQHPDSVFGPAPTLAATATQPQLAQGSLAYTPPGRRLIYHPVKAGETLLSIAYYYSVYVNDLKTWNELKTSTLTQGQTLKVFVRSSSNITQAPSQSTAKAAPKPAQTATSGGAGYTVYKVRSGDSLWTIAQQYPGVSVEDIKKANQLANADKLQPGQTLKIPKAR